MSSEAHTSDEITSLRSALADIANETIIQGMSPALFARSVLKMPMSHAVAPSNQITHWKCVGYCRHCTADEDDSTFSKEWGHFEKSDNGVWVRADSALAEIERLRATLNTILLTTPLNPAARALIADALAGEVKGNEP